jgi:hypothetical protein
MSPTSAVGLLIMVMTLTGMLGMGSLYQHVFARSENSGINVRTHTDQKSNCETAGTSGISDSCTANSVDNVRQSGGLSTQGPVASSCTTSHPTVLSLFVSSGGIFFLSVSGGLTDTCTGLGIPGATITFTGTGVPSGTSTVTDSTGRYDTSLGEGSPGTFTIQAHFAGEGIFGPSASQTQSFTCIRLPGAGAIVCS